MKIHKKKEKSPHSYLKTNILFKTNKTNKIFNIFILFELFTLYIL